MRKINKFFTMILMAFVFTLLVACTPDNGNGNGNGEDTVEISFQLLAVYDELANFGFDFRFMMNMYSDGTYVWSSYNALSYDDSDHADNHGFTEEFITGVWQETKDAEGDDVIEVRINTKKYYGYVEDGVLTVIDLDFPLAEGFSRTVSLSGSSQVEYEDFDSFIQDNLLEFIPPVHVDLFTDVNERVFAYLNAQGVVYVYNGRSEVARGTWDNAEGVLTIKVDETPLTITLDGNKASFNYSVSIGGYPIGEFEFICDDITTLLATEIAS